MVSGGPPTNISLRASRLPQLAWGALSLGDNLVLGRVPIILLAAGLSGCAQAFVYGGGDDVRIHYVRFGATPPQGNTVTVCHAYTCKMQTPYTFSQKDLAEIRAVMAKTEQAHTPYEERRAVAYAIAYIDVKVGNKLGIHDKAGMQFGSSGDPTRRIASTCRPTPRAISWLCRRTACSSTTLSLAPCRRQISARG